MSYNRRIWLVEIEAAIDAAGTLTTLRYGTDGYATLPTDTPPHVFFDPRVKQAALIRRDIYAEATTAGESRISVGEVVLINKDGALDGLADYGFDGRAIRIYTGTAGAAFPAAWTLAFAGTMEQASITEAEVSIRVRDRQAELDVPLSPNKYAGSNVLPDGLEGTAEDVKDQAKPRAVGKVMNVSPPLVNTARLIYQVNDGAVQSVDAAYDMGVALTKGADYTSQADMEANAPAAGGFRVWPAGGYFRLGSTPAGQITADVTAHTTAGSTAAQLVKAIALETGITTSAADVSALDAAQPAVIGLWVAAGEEMTRRQAFDAIAGSVGAWFAFNPDGTVSIARLEVPSGTPALELDVINVTSLKRLPMADPGRGVPSWEVQVSAARNWTQQAGLAAETGALAGGVSAARRAWLAEPVRWRRAADATVKTKHLLAGALSFKTLLHAEADAATEATRRLTIYKTRRDRFETRVRLAEVQLSALGLGVVVRLTHPRFGLSAGRLFRVIGALINQQGGYADLTLWG